MSITELADAGHISDASILLIEDDHGDAVLVQACLFEAGVPDAAITWARSLHEAIAVLASIEPGCILVDLGLPDATGYGAVQALVESVPDIAVIVLTGRQERDGAAALGVGAQDYLVKDAITAELLERSIRYAMERKRAQLAQQQLRDVQLSSAEQARLERGLLPTPILRSESVTCATYYRPGSDNAVLGGDFFDIVEVADGRVRAVIGDVMGHGPDEAALGVHLRVAWRTLLLAGVPDAEILPTLARLLAAEQVDRVRFATVCDLEIADGVVRVRVAGHPAPVVCVAGRATYPELDIGPPLGVPMPGGSRWPVNEIALPAGSSIVLYTDGLLEAYQLDPTSQGLGIAELVDAVADRSAGGRPASSWVGELVSGAPRASTDDTAVVALTNHTGPAA